MLPIRDHLKPRRFPVVSVALIGANVVVFVWEVLLVTTGTSVLDLEQAWGLVPARFVADPIGQLITPISGMFLHDPTGLWHIASNMLALWIFGDDVEDALGRWRFLALYFAAGLAGCAAHVAVDPGAVGAEMGASGAVAGVLAAFVSLYPEAPITMLHFFVPAWFWKAFLDLPAWVVVLEFFAFNLWESQRAHSHVAFFAHLGGFVAGLVLVRVLAPTGRRDSTTLPRARRGVSAPRP